MKIFLDSIGCRLNQSEIESMARQFRAAGHEIVAGAEDADMTVVNTCIVTSAAAADSRSKIRAAVSSGTGEVVATGCWATLVPEKALSLPGVTRVVANAAKELLVPQVLDLDPESFELEPISREPLPGLRQRTRAFIKVQDGCDNACTFCITTVARGAGKSRSITEVIADIQSAVDGGTKEAVLTGVHLGSWGQDFERQLHLSELVRAILTDTDIPRLRLSSLEPWDLAGDFFSLWEDIRLLPHLHLPLQSGSDMVLRRMARKTTQDSYRQLVAAARAVMPEVAVTTDVIAGFPGESEDEFAETLDFIREIGFAGGHVFTYSAREGTPAARMKNHIPVPIRKERNAILRKTFAEMGETYRGQFIGQTMPVLWEACAQVSEACWQMEGLTGNYIRVRANAPGPRWNVIDEVHLIGEETEGLFGEFA